MSRRTSLKYVEEKEKELQRRKDQNNNEDGDDGPVTVLEHFLMRSGMDKKDIVSVVCDTLTAGADTVSIRLAVSRHLLTVCEVFNVDVGFRSA